MVKYSCEKCGKDFKQKSHYDQHMKKKNPCVHENKLKEMITNVVNESIVQPTNEVITIDISANKQMVNVNNEKDDGCYKREKTEKYLMNYLNHIKKPDGTGFKRVLISPLRYAGGKSKAIGLILEYLPKLKHKRIVSPFFGGGSFELAVSQNLGIEVIGYDIFEMLTNFWSILINNKEKFISELEKFEITSDEFTRNRHILLSYWDKVKPKHLNIKQ